MRRLVRALLLMPSVACLREPADVTFAGSDTAVVNGELPVRLAITASDSLGRPVTVRRARFAPAGGDSLQISEDGVVSCVKRSTSLVRVTIARYAKALTVLCRPVRGFMAPGIVRLVVGGAPAALPVQPLASAGSVESVFRARLSMRDTEVATLRAGTVTPRRPGITVAEAEVGDCILRVPIEVEGRTTSLSHIAEHEVFASDSLRVSPATPLRWTLPPGRYRFVLTSGAQQRLRPVLRGEGLNCAVLPETAQGYSCVAATGAELRVEASPRSTKEVSASLFVKRESDSAALTSIGGSRHARLNTRAANQACPLLLFVGGV